MNILTDQNFHEEVREAVEPVVILFSATWCQPCKKFKPVYEEIADQIKDVKFMIADVESTQVVCDDIQIRSVPSLALFINGMVQEVSAGTKNKADLRMWIQESI